MSLTLQTVCSCIPHVMSDLQADKEQQHSLKQPGCTWPAIPLSVLQLKPSRHFVMSAPSHQSLQKIRPPAHETFPGGVCRPIASGLLDALVTQICSLLRLALSNEHYLEEDGVGKDMVLGYAEHGCNRVYDGSESPRHQEHLAASPLQGFHKLRDPCMASRQALSATQSRSVWMPSIPGY